LCPISHLLAKALTEGAIENPGYQSAEAFFNTRLTHDAVKIRWKKDWLHKPVFRDTVQTLTGYDKSDEPYTASKFDNRTKVLGKDSGMEEDLTQYCSRRGFANPVACKCFLFHSSSYRLTIAKPRIAGRYLNRHSDTNQTAQSTRSITRAATSILSAKTRFWGEQPRNHTSRSSTSWAFVATRTPLDGLRTRTWHSSVRLPKSAV
jgi:hypothetical protein